MLMVIDLFRTDFLIDFFNTDGNRTCRKTKNVVYGEGSTKWTS